MDSQTIDYDITVLRPDQAALICNPDGTYVFHFPSAIPDNASPDAYKFLLTIGAHFDDPHLCEAMLGWLRK